MLLARRTELEALRAQIAALQAALGAISNVSGARTSFIQAPAASGGDDTAAMQAAILSAFNGAGSYGGGGVDFANGIYRTSAPLLLQGSVAQSYPSMRICGENQYGTIISAQTAMDFIIGYNGFGTSYPGRIEELNLYGNSSAPSRTDKAAAGLQLTGASSNGVFERIRMENVAVAILKIGKPNQGEGDSNSFNDISASHVMCFFRQSTGGGYNQFFDSCVVTNDRGAVLFDLQYPNRGGFRATNFLASTFKASGETGPIYTTSNTTLVRFNNLNSPVIFDHGRVEAVSTLIDAQDYGSSPGYHPAISFKGMTFTTDFKPTAPTNTQQGTIQINSQYSLGPMAITFEDCRFQPYDADTTYPSVWRAVSDRQRNIQFTFKNCEFGYSTTPTIDPLCYLTAPISVGCFLNGSAFSF